MTENEKKILSKLLKEAAREFGNHGCNDYELPNTPENLELRDKIEAWNVHMTVEEYRASDEYSAPNEKRKTIYFADFALYDYFAKRVLE